MTEPRDTLVENIRFSASNFRSAIESLDKAKLSDSLWFFPRGACGETSLLLGAYLSDQGLGNFNYITGSSIFDGKFESHAWLKQADLIVDITADQFGSDMPSVFVSEDAQWYARWLDIVDFEHGDFRKLEGAANSHALYQQYEVILSALASGHF